jgi:LacI family transcriptional regulator
VAHDHGLGWGAVVHGSMERHRGSLVKSFYRSTSNLYAAAMARQRTTTDPSRVTIYEVAAEAGVSISTVSLALNSPARVSDRTRAKVLGAADALGFVPKTEAVTRARKALGRIGVVAPFTAYASFGRRLNGIFEAVRDTAVDVVVFDQESAATSPSPLLATVPLTHRLDGLVVMGLPLEASTARRLVSSRLPTVLLDVRDDRFDSVHTDDQAGGRLVAEHLVARGHERFAFLGEEQRSHLYVSPSQRRLEGFRSGLEAQGRALAGDAMRLTGPGTGSAREEARDLLAGLEPPVAVFAHNDALAAAVLRAARDLGLRVPEEVAVAGYDDGDLAEALELTTVHQPLEESGLTAARLLLERVHAAGTPARPTRNVSLRLSLTVRGTT